MCRHSPKRLCSSILHSVQNVMKIQLELEEEHAEDDEEVQCEEQTEEEDQDGMQLEHEEQNQSEGQGRYADVDKVLEYQDDVKGNISAGHCKVLIIIINNNNNNGVSSSDEESDNELEDGDNELEEEDRDNELEEEDSDNENFVYCVVSIIHQKMMLMLLIGLKLVTKYTKCQEWVHEICLPRGYCFDGYDDDFACPVCLTGEKY